MKKERRILSLNSATQKYPLNILVSVLDFPQTFMSFSSNETHFLLYFSDYVAFPSPSL